MITVLISEEHGLKEVINTVDPKDGKIKGGREWYLSPKAHSITFVNHEKKYWFKVKYSDDENRFYPEELHDPRTLIKQFLSCKHTSLGQSIVDGFTVEGFQTTDISYQGGFYGQADWQGKPESVDVKIWVDVHTFLPVRSEESIKMKDGRYIHEVGYDFRWNVIVSADDFTPVVPNDYSTDQFIYPEFNEKSVIEGLRLYASLAMAYPEHMDKKALDKDVVRLLNLPTDDVSWNALPEDERNRRNNEAVSITAVGFFYKRLVDENKDPSYYGNKVGPNDTDKALLRWKLADGQYRVIFGDLHADTVTADVMIELETALPK